MLQYFISTSLVNAAARARAAWDWVLEASFRNPDPQVFVAPRGRDRAFVLFAVSVLVSFSVPLAMCGCMGGQIVGAIAGAGSLQASPSSVSFGSVPMGTTTSASVSFVNQGSVDVQVSKVSLAGQSFAVSGAGDLPITVAAGRAFNLNVSFSPAAMGSATGELTISSDTAAGGTLVVALNGAGAAAPTVPTPVPTPVLSTLSCINNAVTGATSDSCTVELNVAAPSGGFTVGLASNDAAATVPASVTVSAGSTSASFTAAISAVTSAQTAILTASAGSVAETFALQLDASTSSQPAASTPVLTGLSCAIVSMTGAGTDTCSVTLNGTALTGGFSVTLASNNLALTVPASISVAAGSNSASFTATLASVTTAQTATMTASANGVLEEFPLQLNVGASGLSINATSVAFGNVPLNSTVTQTVQLTASGPLPIIVAAATVQGSGFSITGATFPLTMAIGQTVMIEVTFDPMSAGAATGQLIIASTALTGGTSVISLSGTGDLNEVSLTWDAPESSPDPVAGYNIYRTPSGSNSYVQLNSAVVTQTSYFDTSVEEGQTYDYIVESVDALGVTSAPSNMASVNIP
ncbi:MAG TPA: choice-of-anchor D domain-containing protein [Terracidiphilus sp.]|jgi:hypothetical protein